VFALLAAALAAAYAPFTSPYPYAYDSADYIYAARLGFWANYVDKGALPLWEFVEKGLELKNNPEKRAEMSRLARAGGDPQLYRHYHGPLYFYFLRGVELCGVREETGLRLAGLAVHIVTALLVMFAFWSMFPQWHRGAGLLAGVLYLLNRTALVTAGEITQHIAFLFTAVLTLWTMSLFCRRLEVRYWYATMASLALAFAAVETASLLAMTLAVVLLALYRPIADKWPSWKVRTGYLLRGLGVFVLTLFFVWQAGVFKLSLLRGFVYLVYIAVSRKTFSPTGPLETWVARFTTAPWEHWPLFLGLVAAVVLWRRLQKRREALPWLLYAGVFAVVTAKVTVEYVHYRGSIALVWTMATAIAVAHVWKRWRPAAGLALSAALIACAAVQAVQRREELKVERATPTSSAHVVSWAGGAEIQVGKTLYVPYYFVPVLHLYYPQLQTVGYDVDWSLSRLMSEIRSPDAHEAFLCIKPVCDSVETALGGLRHSRTLVAPLHDRYPLYAMAVR
jgi:hypothetical protein